MQETSSEGKARTGQHTAICVHQEIQIFPAMVVVAFSSCCYCFVFFTLRSLFVVVCERACRTSSAGSNDDDDDDKTCRIVVWLLCKIHRNLHKLNLAHIHNSCRALQSCDAISCFANMQRAGVSEKENGAGNTQR